MAKKPTKKRTSVPSQAKSETRVTRITASESEKKPSNVKQAMAMARDARASKKPASKKKAKAPVDDERRERRRARNPLSAMLGYFKGSWYELRQVRWPDRRSTWSMTGALLAFTAFFVVFVILIDMAFKYLFKLLIG